MNAKDIRIALQDIAHDIGDEQGWDVTITADDLLDNFFDELRKHRVTVDSTIARRIADDVAKAN